jgi:hypothetical protein
VLACKPAALLVEGSGRQTGRSTSRQNGNILVSVLGALHPHVVLFLHRCMEHPHDVVRNELQGSNVVQCLHK